MIAASKASRSCSCSVCFPLKGMPNATATIDQLIINSPYEEPHEHWKYDRETRLFSRVAGRRPAGYVRATESSKAFDDPGVFVELPLVNKIRPRVKAWSE